MNPIRREVLNGLFVLILSTLLSVGFTAFQVNINVQFWVLILIGVGIALGFYVMFELTLGFMAATEAREKASEESTRQREEEWLKRVGTPARIELNREGDPGGLVAVSEALKVMRLGSDYTCERSGNEVGRTVSNSGC